MVGIILLMQQKQRVGLKRTSQETINVVVMINVLIKSLQVPSAA